MLQSGSNQLLMSDFRVTAYYRMIRIFVVVLFSTVLGACSLVKLTAAGSNVAVLTANEVQRCESVGDITVAVLAKVGVERVRSKVDAELTTLARNTAAERGGDAIVATSEISDGSRDYDVFKCRP